MLTFQHKISQTGDSKGTMPDSQSYALVISAHSLSHSPEKVVHAKRLLDLFVQHMMAGEISASGNLASPFCALFTAVARSSPCEPGKSNEKVGQRDAFTSVVDTAGNAYAIAERTYRELREDAYGISARPDHHAGSAFLKCIARHTAPDSAEREATARMVLEDMCEAGEVSRLVMESLREVSPSMLDMEELQVGELPRAWTRDVQRVFRYKTKKVVQYEETGCDNRKSQFSK